MSKTEARLLKNLKARGTKSPLSSTAAETLVLTRPNEKSEKALRINTKNSMMRRNSSELLKKSFTRAKSSEYLRLITEKNQEIQKLQEDNQALFAQFQELSAMVHKCQRLSSESKEKSKKIEALRSSVNKLRIPNILLESGVLVKPKKKSQKSNKMLNSRLSIGTEFSSFDPGFTRQISCVNRGLTVRSSPKRSVLHKRTSSTHVDLTSLLTRTRKILKGWKKTVKSSNN